MRRFVPGYAIVRVDNFQDVDVAGIENVITIKRIMFDEIEAQKEMDRLNDLNGEKGCEYFVQYTRVDDPYPY